MTDLDRVRTFRLGVVVTTTALWTVALALSGPPTGAAWEWLALAVITATGIGLLLRARFARVLGVALFAACGLLTAGPVLQGITSWSLDFGVVPSLLLMANILATTLLVVWLSLRAVQVLLGRSRGTSVVTARCVGGVLAIIAVHHLWLASQLGFDLGWSQSWSIRISPDGTSLFGFPGWQLVHVAFLVTALVLLAGPRRWLAHAATALLLLVVLVTGLVLANLARAGMWMPELVLGTTIMLVIPVYLAWWLRDELRATATPASP